MTPWTPAKRQASAIKRTKTPAGRRRAILTWCRHVLAALGSHKEHA